MTYALFRCMSCADDPGDDCSDLCACEWADELPPLWADEDDYWPLCRCCGRRGELIVPLMPVLV